MMDKPTRSKHASTDVRNRFEYIITLEETDHQNCLENLHDMAEKGCTEAMVSIGIRYIDGDDKEKGIEYFRKAAELGDNSGMRNLGYCYALGIAVEKNKTKAVEWYRKSALAGNPRAQCNIGVMYEHGNGVDRDLSEAAKWYSMSASNGYHRGQTNLGILLMNGEGIERDESAAARLFEESGSPRANYRLAKMYLEGIGVEEHIPSAIALLEISSAKGYEKSMTLLASLIEEEYPLRAYDLYEQASLRGNVDAKERLKILLKKN